MAENKIPKNEDRYSIDFRSMRFVVDIINVGLQSQGPQTVSQIRNLKHTLIGTLKNIDCNKKLLAMITGA